NDSKNNDIRDNDGKDNENDNEDTKDDKVARMLRTRSAPITQI
ncbi:11534_t:CDS:1, partial [Racocetra persica]